ncbi:unnamed protein product [Calypogeia fissa]
MTGTADGGAGWCRAGSWGRQFGAGSCGICSRAVNGEEVTLKVDPDSSYERKIGTVNLIGHRKDAPDKELSLPGQRAGQQSVQPSATGSEGRRRIAYLLKRPSPSKRCVRRTCLPQAWAGCNVTRLARSHEAAKC